MLPTPPPPGNANSQSSGSDTAPPPYGVVNLGYVIHVIEDPVERARTLKDAFDLAGACLIVAAQVLGEKGQSQGGAYSDGIVMSGNAE